MGRGLPPPLGQDELLLIAPPADVASRFRLPDRVAALFTGDAVEAGLPVVERVQGGLAHLKVGEHLVDLYNQQASTVVHLPALGILCGGLFGSDLLLPRLGAGSDGTDELETLRLLARLVRERKVRLYIPRQGDLASETPAMMERLADDVAYLHGLRRVIPPAARSGDALPAVLALAETLLPANRRGGAARAVHAANVHTLYLLHSGRQN